MGRREVFNIGGMSWYFDQVLENILIINFSTD